MLRLPEPLLAQAFEHFRACGRGRAECVMYFVGPDGGPVRAAVHPRHTASAVGYDVDGTWINQFWLDLARESQRVLLQAHTHPGSTFHSSRDDELALLNTAGFLSLVVPDFGLGPVGLNGAYLAQRDEHGEWQTVDIAQELELSAA
jgi:proteasome lid subunit RPN8/RPN11